MVDYHSVGSIDDLVISGSSLNEIDPEIGGHPLNFKKWFENRNDSKKNLSLELGSLLHEWKERESSFIVAELDKPTDKLATFAEAFFDLYFLEGYKTNENFNRFASTDLSFQLEESLKIEQIYKRFPYIDFKTSLNPNEFQLFARCIFFARDIATYNKVLKVSTVLEHFEKLIEYIKFLQKANGQICIDKVTKDKLFNCNQSLSNHPMATMLFEKANIKEKEFYWEEKIGEVTLKRKAKIDRYFADFENKKLIIVDLKTTSFPVSTFMSANGAFNKYKLGRQLVGYEEAFFKSNPQLNPSQWNVELHNIVVQTTDNFPTQVYKLSFDNRFKCREDLLNIKNRVVYHIKNNIWNITMEEHLYGFTEI